MPSLTSDPWHYSRSELARMYLHSFDLGLQSARGVFARRRMGKTEFLNQDLIPAAQMAGYLTAYANLWDARENPGQALVKAIALALEAQGARKLLKRLSTPVKKLKASGKLSGIAEGGIEAEFGDPKESVSLVLSDVLRKLDKTQKKLLLAIDEAQVLARPEHADFAHALRAGLDIRKRTIKVIFAGSSENTLRRMFGRASEPFYNWAPLEPFDLLGRDFVEYMVTKVNELSRYPLAFKSAMHAFVELHETPDFFRRFLTRYLTHAQLGAKTALEHTKAQVFNDKEFVNYWQTLLPADQEMLRMLAEGMIDLHSIEARVRLAAALGLADATSLNTPQQSLKRLQADSVVTRVERGRYRFEDDIFAEWVRYHGESY